VRGGVRAGVARAFDAVQALEADLVRLTPDPVVDAALAELFTGGGD